MHLSFSISTLIVSSLVSVTATFFPCNELLSPAEKNSTGRSYVYTYLYQVAAASKLSDSAMNYH